MFDLTSLADRRASINAVYLISKIVNLNSAAIKSEMENVFRQFPRAAQHSNICFVFVALRSVLLFSSEGLGLD